MKTTNIKNSYPLKTLTLDCQKTMMRELLMDNKLITSNDFKQPYAEHFKYNPNGTSIEDGNVITGQFGVYKKDVFIRQMDDFDYQLKYPVVFEMNYNENLSVGKEEILIITKHDSFRDLLLIKETRNDGEIWFKVPNSVSSPNVELVIEDLKNQTVKIENTCDETEKAVLNHFKNFIKEIAEYQLRNGVIITDENIHLYYLYMNDSQLKEYKVKLSFIFNSRSIILKQSLFLNDSDKNWLFFEKTNFNGWILSQSFFSIKDTLAPLAEYINEIMSSENYKENYLKPFMIDCLKNGVVITKDNIHLYYEFMSDEDLERNEKVIYHKLMNRASLVQLPLSLTPKDLQKNAEYKNSILTIFGIKDTLKPIDKYIEEIKNSDAYKSYSAND